MYLKNLTLKGFKSFANTVHMSLEPGVTCVVGPNGSGKSNVVDALAWVMGEQGAKNLRGGQMSDVIFAGTKTKAPLGRAEVQLTVDNTDGALPIEYSEVTISRTMFRSGGSEYAINGTPVRLLDIQELLSDTGMGRQMHVIVGQGQLDTVLSASEAERRAFVEEAAGVLKHRQRKDRALRKLESLAVNLSRVQDLTNDVGKRLGPLGKQAEAARKAARVQAELSDATARLLADSVSQYREKAQSQTTSKAQIAAHIQEVETKIAALNQKLSAVKITFDQVVPDLENLTQTWAELNQVAERLDSLGNQAAERVKALDTAADVAQNHQVDTSELEERLAQTLSDIAAAQALVETRQKEVAASIEAENTAKIAELEVRKSIESIQRARADRREALERLRGIVATATSLAEESTQKIARLEESRRETQQRAAAAAAELAEISDTVPNPQQGENPLVKAEEAVAGKVATTESQVAELRTTLASAQADAARWAARREVLAGTLKPQDAGQAVLAADLSGIQGSLPEALVVQDGWEEAIGAVFGAWSGALLANGIEEAADTIRFVREHESGQLHLLVANPGGASCLGNPSDSPSENREPPGKLPEGAHWAVDLVAAHPGQKLPRVVTQLLSGVVACADLGTARELVGAGQATVAVTQVGDYLSTTRVLGGGDPQAGILRRATEFNEASEESELATREVDKLNASLEKSKTNLRDLKTQHQQLVAELKAQDAQMAAAAAKVAAAKARQATVGAEAERVAKDIAAAREEAAKRQEKLAAAQAELEAAQSQSGQSEETQIGELETALTQAIAGVSAAQSAKANAVIESSRATDSLQSLESRAESLRRNIGKEKAAAAAAASAARLREKRRHRAEYVLRQSQVASELAHAAGAAAAAQREVAQNNRESLNQEIEMLRANLDDLQRQRGELNDASLQDQLKLTEVNAKLESLLEKAQNECGLDEDTLISEFGPHNLVPVFDESGETVEHVPYVREEQVARKSKAAAELKRIGKVNPLALEEHAALVARHQFLADQLADLKKSRNDLLDVVAEVDRQVVEVFGAAFTDVAAAFTKIFEVLFPGGEGRLELTDAKDLLNTGIDIHARPAGKNVKRMSLLSGGERSLAALAFLFAIFQARPSPFYVLDEVEAALDDVNLSRLLGVFEILRQNSQLIIITHHKRTMEIADALYGVTMRDGTTTVISQRLASPHEKG
ncbi:chromosome segregation protein [Mobiluncus mulieris]|uniref:Chromosome partition protein Smc n=1 Tax=Mobiluncus mulieris TaxID=2052 RepID=A0A8G2HR32_9ACTO|nr:chromosome segregation protein SMC [Mobiluncus mulieris]EEJ53694.1 chromosome segregation protein SMC [Mobiluncus mulieris ATCC 35243]EFN93899.1 chromosome segregation protein SMC [Mobiluncus mulieris FB024-16]MBB5845554.1 chromosome segregation protein [Mobiluncus mulieris]MCU9975831.1 chromosome segregation protein SMC [Mobiluncus mulieris]MCV0002699.1 chromosome segregation protein SMC [Mobiluncus mulieris]